ncbi:MAG: ATP-binding protein [Desulfurococcales archaeon]|nr:ATP-binding protein [Desulfurococcales archaeon]
MGASYSCRGDRAGWVIGESTPLKSTILFEREISYYPRVGMFVTAESPEGCVLGVVEKIVSGNVLIPGSLSDSAELYSLSRMPEVSGKGYIRGTVRWLSLVQPLVGEGRVVSPSTPVSPTGEVWVADSGLLSKVFGGNGRSWVRLGTLVTDNRVEVRVNADRLTRHLAILAVTGGGKSNTVCVLAKRIVDDLRGTMVVFDMHGEYAGSGISSHQRLSPAKINPASLAFRELLVLARIQPNAVNQERVLREAWKKTLEELRRGDIRPAEILEKLRRHVSVMAAKGGKDTAPQAVLNKLDDLADNYGDVIDPSIPQNLADIIEPGKLNVFDLSSVDEAGADAIVSHYARRILHERKLARSGNGGYPVPLFLVIEEAHILVPRDESTLSKTWIARIAREGRKFGVGLILVSQRPKNVDPDILSQTNNKIILRIIEPTDQKYVQQASEQLSDELLDMLPGLNPGEAVIVGSMVKLPVLAKIDVCRGKEKGGDIPVVEEWRHYEDYESKRDQEILGHF